MTTRDDGAVGHSVPLREDEDRSTCHLARIPDGECAALAEGSETVGVEGAWGNAIDLGGDIGGGRDGCAEVEEAEPAVGDGCQEEVGGVGEERDGRDGFG